MSEPAHVGKQRAARKRGFVAAGAVLVAIGLERLANSYLLGSASALAAVAAERFLIGLASLAAGSALVVVGLGRTSRLRRAAQSGQGK